MKKKSVSIYDISKALDLSAATISRALNHPEQVKKNTLDRVNEYIKQTGFQKRTYAVSGNSEKRSPISPVFSDIYLMSIPTAGNPFYSDIIEGTMAAASQHNCRVYVDYTTINESNINSFLVRAASPFRGIISLQPLSERLLHQISSQIPIVQCSEDAPTYPEVSCITIDNITAEKKATEYLLSLGCRTFAFFTTMTSFRFAEDRLHGLQLALEGANLSIENKDIIRISSMEYQSAFDSALFYLGKNRPDAIVCISDVFAAACINAAKELSIRVPEDLMVIGFDNISVSITTSPSITTIAQPRFQLGFHAFEALYREIHTPQTKKIHMLLATDLLIRQSTEI